MKRILPFLVAIALAGCTAAVSDLGGFSNYGDACDPRPTQHRGADLRIQFVNTTPHINQDMRFAIEVGADRNVEALAIVSTFSDPQLVLELPEMMPTDPSTLAFWADTNGDGVFEPTVQPDMGMLPDAGPDTDAAVVPYQIDHQWFRPICRDGNITFTHSTPFQDISHATSNGSIFRFVLPADLRAAPTLFQTHAMAAWAVEVDENNQRQGRVYYQWHPYVAIAGTTPMQRAAPMFFNVGGNVGTESRGAIDAGSMYEVHFSIDADHDGHFGGTEDYNCVWRNQQASGAIWAFDPSAMPGMGLQDVCDPNSLADPFHT